MSQRGIAPVIGVVTLLVLTIVIAISVMALASMEVPSAHPQLSIQGTVDAAENEITIEHTGGDPISINAVDLHVTIDGTPLRRQPPESGLKHMPSGPLNPQSDDEWAAGERIAFTLAESNEPLPTAKSRVAVRIIKDGTIIAHVELTHVE